MLRAPNRLTVAKKAAASIINNVAPNVPIGFVTLSSCPSAHNHGFYGQSKRGTLKSAISNIFPFVDRSTYDVLPNRQTGTPLYGGLQQAAAMVDGKNKGPLFCSLAMVKIVVIGSGCVFSRSNCTAKTSFKN